MRSNSRDSSPMLGNDLFQTNVSSERDAGVQSAPRHPTVESPGVSSEGHAGVQSAPRHPKVESPGVSSERYAGVQSAPRHPKVESPGVSSERYAGVQSAPRHPKVDSPGVWSERHAGVQQSAPRHPKESPGVSSEGHSGVQSTPRHPTVESPGVSSEEHAGVQSTPRHPKVESPGVSSEGHAGVQSAPRHLKVESPGLSRDCWEQEQELEQPRNLSERGSVKVLHTSILDVNIGAGISARPRVREGESCILEWEPREGLPISASEFWRSIGARCETGQEKGPLLSHAAAEENVSQPTKTESREENKFRSGVKREMALERDECIKMEPLPHDETMLPDTLCEQGPRNDGADQSPPSKRQKCRGNTKNNARLQMLTASTKLNQHRLEDQTKADKSDDAPVEGNPDNGDKSFSEVVGAAGNGHLEPVTVPLVGQDARDERVGGYETKNQTDMLPETTEIHERLSRSFGGDYSFKDGRGTVQPSFSGDSEEIGPDTGDQDVAEGPAPSERTSMDLSFSVAESEDLCSLGDFEITPTNSSTFRKSRQQDEEDSHVRCIISSPGERNPAACREIDEFEIPLPISNSGALDLATQDAKGCDKIVDNFRPPPAFDVIKRMFRVQNESFDLTKFLASQGIVRD